MQLSHIAEIITAAGAGPLAFVALGLLILTYLSARWFGSERTAVRITVFAFLFLLICATPILIWLSEHYRDPSVAANAADAGAVDNAAAPAPSPTASEPLNQRRAVRPAAAAISGRASPAFAEESETVRLPVSRFEAALRSKVFTVYFPHDSSAIAESEEGFLGDVADEFGRRAASGVMLAGHTDRHETASNNIGVSGRMADAVKDYLVRHGVPEAAISTEAFGESRPAVETADGMPEPRNRRVEISFR